MEYLLVLLMIDVVFSICFSFGGQTALLAGKVWFFNEHNFVFCTQEVNIMMRYDEVTNITKKRFAGDSYTLCATC